MNKNILIIFAVIAFVSLLGVSFKGQAGEAVLDHDVPSLNTGALEVLINSGVPLVILDARSSDSSMQVIPGAHVVRYDAKAKVIQALVPNREALIVTYCGGLTCSASNKLADRLGQLGYVNVIEYPLGIAGWKEAGNKTASAIKAKPKQLKSGCGGCSFGH